jgi:outer membrane protease
VRCALSVEDLWDVETYFTKKGGSEFLYDEGLDVFRFPEDRRLRSVGSSPIGNSCKSEGT